MSTGASLIWFFVFIAWCIVVICLLSRLFTNDNEAAPQTLLIAPPLVITRPPVQWQPIEAAAPTAGAPIQQELATQPIPSTNPAFQSVTTARIPSHQVEGDDATSRTKGAHTQVIDLPSNQTSVATQPRPTQRISIPPAPISSYFTIAEKYRSEMAQAEGEKTKSGKKNKDDDKEKHNEDSDEPQRPYVTLHEETQPASPSQIRLSPQHHAIEMSNASPTVPTQQPERF